MLTKSPKKTKWDTQVWGGYLQPLGGGMFHLYNPTTDTCYRGHLRGALKKGRRSETSLRPYQVLYLRPIVGSKNYLIVEKTDQFIPPVDLQTHECNFR